MRQILFSGVIGLFLSLVGTPVLIKLLASRGYGQFIRDDGPTSHHTKRGTPTMGGAVIVLSSLIAYGVAHLVTGQAPTVSGLLVLFLMTGLGFVGFLDDFIKIRNQRSLGLRSGEKLAGQTLVAVVFAILALQFPNDAFRTPDGAYSDEPYDPAMAPVIESGGGVAEGFEQSEALLVDHASHGDDEGTERILEDAFDEEAEEDRGVYGEADEEDVSEDET